MKQVKIPKIKLRHMETLLRGLQEAGMVISFTLNDTSPQIEWNPDNLKCISDLKDMLLEFYEIRGLIPREKALFLDIVTLGSHFGP